MHVGSRLRSNSRFFRVICAGPGVAWCHRRYAFKATDNALAGDRGTLVFQRVTQAFLVRLAVWQIAKPT